MKYIEVFKEQTPYVMQVPLPNRFTDGDGTLLYDIEVTYNTRHDFFSLSLGLSGERLISGEKLVLNQPIRARGILAPNVTIVPRNRPEQRGEAIYENMGDTVLLAIEGDEDEAVEA